jgi:hypothetical protein
LAKSGRVSKAGGMFRQLGSMLYNGSEMMRAREITHQNKRARLQEAEEQEHNKEEAALEDATEAYAKHKRGDKLGSGNLKALVKVVVMLENHRTKGKEGFSQYCSSKENMWKRRRQSPWESYLAPSTADSEAELERRRKLHQLKSISEATDVFAALNLELEIDEAMVLSVHLVMVSDDGPLGMSALANPTTGVVTIINVQPKSLAELYDCKMVRSCIECALISILMLILHCSF